MNKTEVQEIYDKVMTVTVTPFVSAVRFGLMMKST